MSNTNRKKIMCHRCGEWCGSGRKYCKPCRDAVKTESKEHSLSTKKSDAVYSKGEISNRYSLIRYHARETHLKHIKTCQNCGYSKHIEICHIKPIKHFSEQATIKEINHIDNIIGLCPNCHWEFDHGLLKLPCVDYTSVSEEVK